MTDLQEYKLNGERNRNDRYDKMVLVRSMELTEMTTAQLAVLWQKLKANDNGFLGGAHITYKGLTVTGWNSYQTQYYLGTLPYNNKTKAQPYIMLHELGRLFYNRGTDNNVFLDTLANIDEDETGAINANYITKLDFLIKNRDGNIATLPSRVEETTDADGAECYRVTADIFWNSALWRCSWDAYEDGDGDITSWKTHSKEEIKTVTSVGGQTGNVNLKTVEGNLLTGNGNIKIGRVNTLDGKQGDLTLKTINGNVLLGSGDIKIEGGGGSSPSPTGTTMYFRTYDGETWNATNIKAYSSGGTLLSPSVRTSTGWSYDEIVDTFDFFDYDDNQGDSNLLSFNGLSDPAKLKISLAQAFIYENCRYADLSKFIVTDIGASNDSLIYWESLRWLDITTWDTHKWTTTNQMFYNCLQLKYLNLNHFNTHNVTDMGYMFCNCKRLEALDCKWDTSNVTIMNEMFCNCSAITYLDLSSWDTSNVTNSTFMFLNCTALEELNLNGWDCSKMRNSSSPATIFAGCKSLKTVYAKGCNEYTVKWLNTQVANAKRDDSDIGDVEIITE